MRLALYAHGDVQTALFARLLLGRGRNLAAEVFHLFVKHRVLFLQLLGSVLLFRELLLRIKYVTLEALKVSNNKHFNLSFNIFIIYSKKVKFFNL